jgi:hypothetical protein
MDNVTTGSMRFWRYEAGEIKQGSIYIARGLKVVLETVWCQDLFKYVPREDNAKTVECCWRTALEDVTHVNSIAEYF